MLWFDTVTGLNDDNACAGCHSPAGFGDTQSIAGIDNNGIVGPGRTGPRNQRRAPMVINPRSIQPDVELPLAALSGNPFDNRPGSSFRHPKASILPAPPARGAGFIPPTERVEVAGFDFPGDNNAIRDEVLRRLNNIPAYRRSSASLPGESRGQPITFDMLDAQSRNSSSRSHLPTLPSTNRPWRPRGKRFPEAGRCSFSVGRVRGLPRRGRRANEMFSDFQTHDLAVPRSSSCGPIWCLRPWQERRFRS